MCLLNKVSIFTVRLLIIWQCSAVRTIKFSFQNLHFSTVVTVLLFAIIRPQALYAFEISKIHNNAVLIPLSIKPFSRSGINTAIFRKNAFITIDETQLLSYIAETGKVVLVKRSLDDGKNLNYQTFDNPMPQLMLGDGHQGVNLGYTQDKRIHLIWGCHATVHPQYLQLAWPSLVTEKSGHNYLALGSKSITYPQFFRAGEVDFMIYRNDEVFQDAYSINFIYYDMNNHIWSGENKPPWILFADTERLAYLNLLGVNDHLIVASYVIRRYDLMDAFDDNMRVINTDYRIIFSRDSGKSWNDLKANIYNSTIPALDVPAEVEIPPGEQLINQGGGVLGPDDIYYVGYFRNDKQGIPQIHITSFDLREKKTTTRQVTNQTESFELLGRGTQSWPLSRPALINLNGQVFVIYRQVDQMWLEKVNVHASGAGRRLLLLEGNLGNYEPIVDVSNSKSTLLTLYLQRVEQGKNDTVNKNTVSSEAFIFDLDTRLLKL